VSGECSCYIIVGLDDRHDDIRASPRLDVGYSRISYNGIVSYRIGDWSILQNEITVDIACFLLVVDLLVAALLGGLVWHRMTSQA
jgi:hypothetical protein